MSSPIADRTVALEDAVHRGATLVAEIRAILPKRNGQRHLADSHPLTPEERSQAAEKAWDTRGRTHRPVPPAALPADHIKQLLDVLHTQGPAAALAAGPERMRADVTALFANAPAANQELRTTLAGAVGAIGGAEAHDLSELTEGPGVQWEMGPIKTLDRTVEKTLTEYQGNANRVQDVVRATVAVADRKDVEGVVAAIRQPFEVVREKNSFEHPKQGCYRDSLINVRFKNGLVGEIQVHYKPLLKAKTLGGGHRLYTQIRALPALAPAAALAPLLAASCRLYNAAWSG